MSNGACCIVFRFLTMQEFNNYDFYQFCVSPTSVNESRSIKHCYCYQHIQCELLFQIIMSLFFAFGLLVGL